MLSLNGSKYSDYVVPGSSPVITLRFGKPHGPKVESADAQAAVNLGLEILGTLPNYEPVSYDCSLRFRTEKLTYVISNVETHSEQFVVGKAQIAAHGYLLWLQSKESVYLPMIQIRLMNQVIGIMVMTKN